MRDPHLSLLAVAGVSAVQGGDDMSENGNGHWRSVALFLAGVVMTMAGFYVAEFRRTLTRDEAVQLIEQMRPGPPWVQDRSNVLQRLNEDRARIADLEQRKR